MRCIPEPSPTTFLVMPLHPGRALLLSTSRKPPRSPPRTPCHCSRHPPSMAYPCNSMASSYSECHELRPPSTQPRSHPLPTINLSLCTCVLFPLSLFIPHSVCVNLCMCVVVWDGIFHLSVGHRRSPLTSANEPAPFPARSSIHRPLPRPPPPPPEPPSALWEPCPCVSSSFSLPVNLMDVFAWAY